MTDQYERIPLSGIIGGMRDAVKDPVPILHGVANALRAGPHRAWSIGCLLEEQAKRYPHRPALRLGDEIWTYSELNAKANRIAALLQGQGIGAGDVVAILMETRLELLACVAATVKLGAIAGMLNYQQRDAVLEHSIGLIHPKLLITSAECVPVLETTAFTPQQNSEVVYYWLPDRREQTRPKGFRDLLVEAEPLSEDNPVSTRKVRMQQPCFYIFTSGTTGMPKASIMSHYRWLMGMSGVGLFAMRLRPTDVFYVTLPFYHNNALTVSWGAAMGAGACMALSPKFSASRFWEDVRRYQATAFCYIGELCRYLLNQPASSRNRDHSVRVIAGNGLRPEIWQDFKDRFGISRIAEFYGASESNLGFINFFNLDGTVGLCPLPFAIVACDPETEEPLRNAKGRLQKVGPGGVGLLLMRISKRAPFDGYTDPGATEKKLLRHAFRNNDCWFNTGDLVRDQGFKHIQFMDRLGDTFRWKGENVATTEVEAVINSSDQVDASVVYGVQVPGADGRAGMAAITLTVPVGQLDLSRLATTLGEQLPGYAVPLFLRIRDAHETTGTFKNRKVELKKEGFDPSQTTEPIFYYAGTQQGYLPLEKTAHEAILSGRIRL